MVNVDLLTRLSSKINRQNTLVPTSQYNWMQDFCNNTN